MTKKPWRLCRVSSDPDHILSALAGLAYRVFTRYSVYQVLKTIFQERSGSEEESTRMKPKTNKQTKKLTKKLNMTPFFFQMIERKVYQLKTPYRHWDQHRRLPQVQELLCRPISVSSTTIIDDKSGISNKDDGDVDLATVGCT